MNRRTMSTVRTRFLAFCLPLVLLTGACGSGAPAADPPLAGAAIGGPFELVDKTGKTVRWSDFDGKYRMIYFGYAYCPDVCPLDVQRMMQGFARFKQAEPGLAAQVQPIFVTVDPQRDTPAKVGEFAAAFSDDLIGLTGSVDRIDAAAKAFGVFYERGEPGPGGGYLVNHSRSAYLMGRDGKPIALLPVDEGADQVTAVLEKWVS
jgi:protein SCO1/2